MRLARRRFAAGLAALAGAATLPLLAACGRKEAGAAGPLDFRADTTCDLDGMTLSEYAGPKAQVLFTGDERPRFFCDTVEMFALLLRPEQARAVRGAWVQDMATADWDRPAGHWTDAKAAFYVRGSRRRGPMGPTLASFASREGAQRFAAQWGGQVLAFSEVTPEMADLTGGALHDSRM